MRVETVRQDLDLTVGDIGRHIARTDGGRIALDDGERRLTYRELADSVDALAAALADLGVVRGTIVSAYLPNCIEYVLTVLAVARAGGIFSPLNPRFRSGELTPILRKARPSIIIAASHMMPNLREALISANHECRIVCCGDDEAGTLLWDRLLSGPGGRTFEVAEGDIFSLLFTSGTTSGPKGALSTHRARMRWVLNACILYRLGENDRYVGTMPLVHSAGLTFTLMHLYVGGTVHILREFSPEGYLDLVERVGITSSLVVPTMLVMILEQMRTQRRERDLSSLRRLVTCGSPLPQETKRQVLDRITNQLWDYYGSTESNSMTVLGPPDQLRKAGSVGRPFLNVEIRIVGESGEDLPAEESGEVWCRNPSLMTGYLGDDSMTGAVFTGDWFHTGDVGYLDDEGFLFLVGRMGDIIISGGINIYPAEIEDVLMSHPDVLDCAVVGRPHPKWGQCVAAYVVPREGHDPQLSDLQEHCTRTLADYKKPRVLELVPAIPKNAGGKTIKSVLAESSQ